MVGAGLTWICWRANLPILRRGFLPHLINTLNLRGEGVEIGVAGGVFSQTVLTRSGLRVLYSVDLWRTFPEEEYKDVSNCAQKEMDAKHALAKTLLAQYGKRSVLLRAASPAAAQLFTDVSLDFVYIDANHTYANAAKDIAAWWPKVKQGGIFAGHDYLDGNLPQGIFGVKSAVDDFIRETNETLYVTPERWPTWYVIKEKA